MGKTKCGLGLGFALNGTKQQCFGSEQSVLIVDPKKRRGT